LQIADHALDRRVSSAWTALVGYQYKYDLPELAYAYKVKTPWRDVAEQWDKYAAAVW